LPSLVFIYLLLGILGAAVSQAFFTQSLTSGRVVPSLVWALFLSVLLAIGAFLLSAVVSLVKDILAKRAGGKLRARLFAFFIATAVLASVPSVVIASRFVAGILDLWYSADFQTALDDANYFALDAYRYRLLALESAASSVPAERASAGSDSARYSAVQVFVRGRDGSWGESIFRGNRSFALPEPPAFKTGFLPRDQERDRDVARFVAASGAGTVTVWSLSLGDRFEERTARVAAARDLVNATAGLRPVLNRTLFLFYATFLLPTLLMTLLIAFSLTESVTRPLVGLSDATRRVAEGDFSIRILSRSDDELGALVASFNTMVRELEKSRAALLHTEKINIWQDMAQRLAHEIKNPLTPIKLSAERVLRRAKTDPGRLEEILEPCMLAIIQEVDGLSTMLTEFRTFARLPPPTMETYKLRSVVEDSVALYRSSYPGIVFDCAAVDPDIEVEVDRRHISQVLANLIVNAVDSMKGRGRLDFAAELVKKRDSRYCRLSVRDDGAGIPEDQRPFIFTPYFTTKESGTGLGLSIVERIINDHGGSVWVDSAEGAGATFYIDLPVARKQ
jgi:nitrogen fixation/metabolism regulation signal transduction histidine kinase